MKLLQIFYLFYRIVAARMEGVALPEAAAREPHAPHEPVHAKRLADALGLPRLEPDPVVIDPTHWSRRTPCPAADSRR